MHAFIFPGQGAQKIGMGKELAKTYPQARDVFAEVDDALGQKLSTLIWSGDIEELTLTENAQPALMATSIAAFRALKAEGIGINKASYVAGHSLGEYSALTAAGALTLADTARLLKIRGQAMQAAVPVGKGAMAAILGLDFNAARTVADSITSEDEICEAANDNDPTQVVLSGTKPAIERAIILAKEKGAKRAMLLPVSAPFHSTLMHPAAKIMEEALQDITISAPKVPVIANVTAQSTSSPQEIRKLLVAQVTGSVRWRESILYMKKNGVINYWEIGTGKALCAMVRRIDRQAHCQNVATPEDIKNIKETI